MDVMNPEKKMLKQTKSEFGFIKLLLTITIAVMMGVLSTPAMYDHTTPPAYRLPIFGATLGVLLILSAGRIGKFSKQRLWMIFLWLGFGSLALISAMHSREDTVAALWLFLGVPYIIFCVFPQAVGKSGKKIVAIAIVLAFVPYVVASLIKYPLVSPYLGVFTNSNLFGMIAATISAGLFVLLRGAIAYEHKNLLHFVWIWSLILGLTVAAAFILIVKSSSRTSLLTYAVSCMIFFWSLFFEARKNRFWIVILLIAIIGTTSFLAFSVLTGDAQGRYFRGIVSKMEAKLDSQDPFAGRFEIWKAVLADIKPFGYGTVSFPARFGANAHNTYVMVLGAMGPVALVFLVAIHGMAAFLGVKMVIRNIRQDGYALGPLMIIMNYITLGFAELVFGILGNGIQMSFLLMVGILVNENWNDEKSVQAAENESMPSRISLVGGESQ